MTKFPIITIELSVTFRRVCRLLPKPSIRSLLSILPLIIGLFFSSYIYADCFTGTGSSGTVASGTMTDTCTLGTSGTLTVNTAGAINVPVSYGFYGVDVNGVSATSVSNNGLIRATYVGIYLHASSGTPSLVSIINAGSIYGTDVTASAIEIASGTIGDINNQTTTGIQNTGTIGSSSGSKGISNAGTIYTINNGTSSPASGTIQGLDMGIANTGTITTLTNNSGGSILGAGNSSWAIYNAGTIQALTNSGLIGIAAGMTAGIGIFESGSTTTTLTNNVGGRIEAAGAHGKGIRLDSLSTTIGTLSNAGTISGGAYGIDSSGTISTLTNSGTISGGSASGIINAGRITTLTNTGSITGTYGIDNNAGTIITLNNLQSNLTYTRALPTNYNIIINSTSDFGKLTVTGGSGSTAFGINVGSAVNNNHVYTSILSGVTASQVTNTSGTFGGYNWLLNLQSGSSTIWDLLFGSLGPSAVDTQSSLRTSALRLRNIFNVATISTDFANMNTYDCNLFDTKGMCISAGGRYTTVDNPSANFSSAVVVVGYKATPNVRIGGFLDQNVSNNTPTGIKVSNKNPLMGIFAVWNQNANGLGYQVKVANAYQDKDVSTTRDVVGTSEAGTGATNLNTQSYVGELSYAFLANEDKTLVRPYAALRYTRIKQDGYTESSSVSTPLTYAALADRSTTALVGVKLNHKIAEKVNLTGSLGIEQDLNHQVDNLTATGVSSLTSENFNDNIKRTRPVASVGAYYMPVKNQRIAADLYYQQLPFQSTGSATAYVNYTIGF